MAKGDKKTCRGKIFKGSYGKSRPQRTRKKTGQKAPADSRA